jgi:hypothetical protein
MPVLKSNRHKISYSNTVVFIDFDGTIADTKKFKDPVQFRVDTLTAQNLMTQHNISHILKKYKTTFYYVLTDRLRNELDAVNTYMQHNFPYFPPKQILSSYGPVDRFIKPSDRKKFVAMKVATMIEYSWNYEGEFFNDCIYIDSEEKVANEINNFYSQMITILLES